MASDLRAFAVGLLLFVGGAFAFFESSTPAAGTLTPSALSFVIGYCTPPLSGAVCAFLAGRRRFGTLLCLGVAGAAAFTLIDRLWYSIGFSIVGGISQTEWLLGIALLTIPLLVLIGGWIGVQARRRLALD